MLAQIDDSWQPFFVEHQSQLAKIESTLSSQRITPALENVFRVFNSPIGHYRCVIVGQDPYPSPGYASGLAFSVSADVTRLPASLKNIFLEYVSDTGFSYPKTGDLSDWADHGVALLNTSLSLNLDDKSEHLKIGWQQITQSVLAAMASRGIVAILWGSHAQKIGSCFTDNQKIQSVHPSPLSAHRGFFGSKPFTRCNQLLVASGKAPIDWRLP